MQLTAGDLWVLGYPSINVVLLCHRAVQTSIYFLHRVYQQTSTPEA